MCIIFEKYDVPDSMKIFLVVQLKPGWPNSWRWKLFVEMARIINAFSVYMRWLLNPPSYIQQGYIDH